MCIDNSTALKISTRKPFTTFSNKVNCLVAFHTKDRPDVITILQEEQGKNPVILYKQLKWSSKVSNQEVFQEYAKHHKLKAPLVSYLGAVEGSPFHDVLPQDIFRKIFDLYWSVFHEAPTHKQILYHL